MAFLRTIVKSTVLVGLCGAWLQAQSTADRLTEAPQGRPRIVSIAPPLPPSRADDYGPTVFRHLATTVLADGRVMLDLGNAYEEVAGPCVYAYDYVCVGYGYPIFLYPTVFYAPLYVEPVYVAPIFAAPVYAAPVYPTIVYPAAGYPTYQPRGCYSCGYRSRTYVRSAPTPAGTVHAAPARAIPGRVLPPSRSGRP